MTNHVFSKSRIFIGGPYEVTRRVNLLFGMMKALSGYAAELGASVLTDVESAHKSNVPAVAQVEGEVDVRFYAYFAGANARSAFTVAQRVLDLYEERRQLGGHEIDFRRYW